MNKKDTQYRGARAMIETHSIKEFREIFDYVPKSTVARDMGKNNTRMEDLKENVHKLTIGDLFTISSLLGVDHVSVFMLIANQYINDMNNSNTK
ncbi:MAG: hypothetical protein QM731_28295 [Chitinophagaceae bacterium]